ncbi:MAG: anti-sigma factor family protein [Maioricimonas sp. JB049]
MLSPDHQELLSAHFDGELADEERAQVDALLVESPEARELLQEFDEISTTLRDIAVPDTPGEIRAAVLERIAATVPPAPKPSSRRPAWQRWLAPALAASLALVVTVWVQVRPRPAPTASPMADAVTTPANPEHLNPGAAGMEAATGITPETLAFADEAGGEVASGGQGAILGDLSGGAATGLSERLFPAGSRPVPGEIRSLLGQRGEAPVLVNYTVVDVEKAAGRMRVLLSQNGIHEIAATRQATANEGEAAPRRESLEEDRLFALYVEAPQDQVVAALNDIDGIREVVDVSADYAELSDNLSVKAEALPYRMQQKWIAAEQSALRSQPAPSSSASPAPSEPPLATSDGVTPAPRQGSRDAAKPGDAPAATGAGGTGAGSKAAAKEQLGQVARELSVGGGVQMQVSEEQLEKLMLLRTRKRRLAESYQLTLPHSPDRPPAPPAPEPLDNDSQATDQGLSGRRVKVLLILQDQSDQ